jgi:hypothetical protein
VDFDHPIRKLPDISDVLQVARKNHDGERTNPEVVTEIKVSGPSAAVFNANDLSGDALVFAKVRAGLVDRKTLRRPAA